MKKFSLTTRANSRRTSPTKYILQVIILGVVLSAVGFFLPRLAFTVSALVMVPLHETKQWFSESGASLPLYLRNRTALLDEMAALKQQLANRDGDRFTVDMLAAENRELRSLLGDNGETRIVAGVISRANPLPYDMLLLDKGQRDGIVEGAAVYIGDRTVVGFVQSVTETNALVTLITTSGFTSTVYVLGPNIFTTAVGQGGGQLRVGIPQGIIVKEGDAVILPAVTSGIYGTVSYVESQPTQPLQFAYVSPDTPIQSLHLVAVGTTPLRGTNFEAALANVEAVRNELFSLVVPPGHQPTSTLPSTSSSTETTSSSSAP